jgi:hypothetical protein
MINPDLVTDGGSSGVFRLAIELVGQRFVYSAFDGATHLPHNRSEGLK